MQTFRKLNWEEDWLYTSAIMLCTCGIILGIFLLLLGLSFIFPTLMRIASIGIMSVSLVVSAMLIPSILKTRDFNRKLKEEFKRKFFEELDPTKDYRYHLNVDEELVRKRTEEIIRSFDGKLNEKIAEMNQRANKEPKE